MNKLFLEFHPDFSYISSYVIFNIVMLLLSLTFIVFLLKKNVNIFSRLSFVIATQAHFIFQWPLALYSYIFETSLLSYWFFSLSIHTIVFSSLLWAALTRAFTRTPPKLEHNNPDDYQFPPNIFIIINALTFIVTLFYLIFIPFACTGLYAFIFDPEFTLLARELSGKLSSSKLPFYAYGALVNVLCPLLLYANFYKLFFEARRKNIMSYILLACSTIFVFFVLFLSGTKGNFLPTILALFIGLFVLRSQYTFLGFFKTFVPVFLLGMSFILAVELIKERSVENVGRFDFGYCAQRLGSCKDAQALLYSLEARDDSLGFANSRLVLLQEQLKKACPIDLSEPVKRTVLEVPKVSPNNPAPAEGVPVNPSPPITSDVGPPIATDEVNFITKTCSRISCYAFAIFYRAAVVPTQLASWYFKYVEDHGSPGIYALPQVAKLFGEYVCVSQRINQTYGVIYSCGANVSTGTAPTSFLLAYSAYYGFLGLVGAIACILILDLISSLILLRLGNVIRPIGIGLIWVISYNFLASDLLTALMSHGVLLSLILLFVFSLLNNAETHENL